MICKNAWEPCYSSRMDELHDVSNSVCQMNTIAFML